MIDGLVKGSQGVPLNLKHCVYLEWEERMESWAAGEWKKEEENKRKRKGVKEKGEQSPVSERAWMEVRGFGGGVCGL